ncbi:MAG: hypothetical protein DKINENOH_05675 [bacterium]|nr:hypothetical protein [bacterium]
MSIDLHCNDQHARVAPGSSLFEYAESMGIRVPTSCLQQGKCKECLVEILAGMECLSAPVAQEKHLRGNFRLSCRTRIVTDSGVVRCHTLRRGNMRIETRALQLPVEHQNLRLDPAVTRDGERILLEGEEIDHRSGPFHGLAVDLGTTTVVLRLLNLETGEIIADTAFENPQRFGGSEVMSRIHYDSTHPGKLLQRTLARYVNHALAEFPVDPASIYEVVVAGNSTMRDLFFRLNVHSIGQSPYQSFTEQEMAGGLWTTTSLTATARRLLLRLNPKARVYGLPIISGHVGADAAACMLAVNLANEERLVAIMDIGTNTELIVGNKHRILAASCPAGPAFEGGNLSCGMPGLPGAIERVRINDEGKVDYSVIEGNEPEGICGSGLIDLLSELLRTGQINPLGRFEHGDKCFVLHENGAHQIYLNESDINELAQAKGANVAGLQIVCDQYGIGFQDLEVFYLAGGFGRHLNIDAARRIGLLPNIDTAKILQVGNAAIEGAGMALLSRSKREELEGLVRKVEHCRLETHPRFFDYFVEGCQFNPIAMSLQT